MELYIYIYIIIKDNHTRDNCSVINNSEDGNLKSQSNSAVEIVIREMKYVLFWPFDTLLFTTDSM